MIWCLYAVLFLICFYFSEIFTIQGNTQGRPCYLPFLYDGQWFHSCTGVGREDGHLWCATTYDYGKDERWGFCPVKSESTFHTTYFSTSLSAPIPKISPFQKYIFMFVPTQWSRLKPLSHAVLPCKVLEDFLYGVMCEWDQGSIFWEICTGNLPAQDLIIFPEHCLYSCVWNEISNIVGRGT